MKQPLRNHSGFTLLELIVAAATAGIVVLGFLSATTTFFSKDSQQRQQIAVQQSLRMASWVSASDVRQAGYIYPDPTVPAALIPNTTLRLPAGSTPKLALLVPASLNANNATFTASASSGKFVLVIYAVGDKPATPPYSNITSIAANPAQVIYRWVSSPGDFDPRTQLDGDNNPPATLSSTRLTPAGDSNNLITYGGNAGDTFPPILAGNIDGGADGMRIIFDTTVFGPFNSPTGATLSLKAYLSVSKTDSPKGVPVQSSYLQARNLGLPPKPLPSFGGGSGGNIRTSCVATDDC